MAKKGDVLITTFEHYEVLGSLGSGGSGDVVSVKDSSGTTLAVKLLRPNQPKVKMNRFKNELSFCSSNDHPNILKILDRGVNITPFGEQPFYVMPLYSSTLRGFIASNATGAQRLATFVKILDGVEAAHLRQIIHRDLKPENILLNLQNGELVVADFGIAHFEEDDLLNTG
jgi:serine/threonine protein kinase